MLTRTFAGVLFVSLAVVIAAAAQTPPPRQATIGRRPDAPSSRTLPGLAARGTSVMGYAWSATNDPITDAAVRLRNVLTGSIEATAVTSKTGEFVFENLEGGATYVVELVDESWHVRAVGHPFTVAPGETVATFVRLGVPAPWLVGLFSNTAAAAVSSAASVGIAAIAPPTQPLSATR